MDNGIPEAYIAGLFDGGIDIIFRVNEDELSPTGYECFVGLRFETSRDPALVGVLAEYSETRGILSQTFKTSGGFIWLITGEDRVKQFLNCIEGKLWRQTNDINLMLNEIVPRLEENAHHTEKGLIELMGYAGQLEWRKKFNQYNRYTKDKFVREFEGG